MSSQTAPVTVTVTRTRRILGITFTRTYTRPATFAEQLDTTAEERAAMVQNFIDHIKGCRA